MVADALAPYSARSSTAMVLFIKDKKILVFHEDGFQLPMIWNANVGKNIYNTDFIIQKKFSM